MLNGIQNAWSSVSSWLSGIGSRVSSAVGYVWNAIQHKGSDIINGLYNGITSTWSTVSSWFGALGSKVSNAVGSV